MVCMTWPVIRGRQEQFTSRDSASFGLEWSVRLKAMSSAVRGASWPRHQILLPELRLKVSGHLILWNWCVWISGVQKIASSAQWMFLSRQITSQSWPKPFPAQTNRRSRLLRSYGTMFSVCMGFQGASTQIKEPTLRVSSLQSCFGYRESPSRTLQLITPWGTEELRDLTGLWGICSVRYR